MFLYYSIGTKDFDTSCFILIYYKISVQKAKIALLLTIIPFPF